MKVAIIGSGAWGTAIAKVLAERGLDVSIWSFESEVERQINEERENKKYLPNIKIKANINASTELFNVCSGASYIFLVTPSLHTLSILKEIINLDLLKSNPQLAILTKGFLELNGKTMLITDGIESILPDYYKKSISYIAGPSHAEEVARDIVTGLMIANKDKSLADEIISLFNSTCISLFYTSDIIGTQVSAAVKNIFAIAFGILDAIEERGIDKIGNNTQSLLYSLSLNDMKNIGVKCGSQDIETYLFLSGSGDLDVTCRSVFGRNRRFGREIITKDILKDFEGIEDLIKNIGKISYLPEGVFATKYTKKLLNELGDNIENSLVGGIYKILNKEINPNSIIEYIKNYKS